MSCLSLSSYEVATASCFLKQAKPANSRQFGLVLPGGNDLCQPGFDVHRSNPRMPDGIHCATCLERNLTGPIDSGAWYRFQAAQTIGLVDSACQYFCANNCIFRAFTGIRTGPIAPGAWVSLLPLDLKDEAALRPGTFGKRGKRAFPYRILLILIEFYKIFNLNVFVGPPPDE